MTLEEASWRVDEPTYRADPALSYSTISTYEHLGFSGLDKLFDKKTSPSLTFGSMVDTLITDGQEAFDQRFMVVDMPELAPKMQQIFDSLFANTVAANFDNVTDDEILRACDEADYGKTWKPLTRISKVVESGIPTVFEIKRNISDKEVVSSVDYEDCIKTVEALRNSDSTRWYFQSNSPFDEWQRFYQLKFKATLNGIDYRCMADLLCVNDQEKTIMPTDLKTGSVPEWEFYNNFVKWHYQMQARLYPRIIKEAIKDTPFKDYKWLNYRFIYVNRNTLTPLVWEFPYTYQKGRIVINDIIMEDPEVLGKELKGYLDERPVVPSGINLVGTNDIVKWLNIKK